MKKIINKNGFTLIELLATILVLAIIMMIAYPRIRGVIDESKRSAFLTTAKGVLASTDNYYGLKTSTSGFTPDLVYDLVSGDTIKFTGGDFKTGEVTIDEYGNTALALWDGTYCIVKDFDDENDELTIVKNKTGANCDVENIDKMIHYGTTGYLCSDPGSTVSTDQMYFTFVQATKTITGYSNLGPKDVVIPCTIGGVNVENIASSAFSSKSLTSLIMPDTILTIGANAFLNNQIVNLSLGNSITTIGYGAFKGNKIVTLVLPDSLKTIESPYSWPDGTFTSNPLTSVTFGSGITTIGYGAFSFTDKLVNVDFSRSVNLTTIADCAFIYSSPVIVDLSNSTKLSSIGEHAFKYGKIADLKINGDNLNIKTWAFESNLIANLELNGKIINIGTDAFKNNQLPDNQAFIYGKDALGDNTSTLVSYAGANRSNITIPNTITSITSASFGSLGLTGTLNTGNGLTSIEASKFASNSLTNVVIGNAVTAIGTNAFLSNQIVNLSIGNSVTTIGYGAFKSNKIVTLVLPDSLKTIENASSWPDGTFASNPLTTVTFGSGITTIGYGAFSFTDKLANVDFSRSINLTTIADCAFIYSGLIALDLSNSTKLSSIGEHAFKYGKITDLKIYGDNLNIKTWAFESNLIANLELNGKIINIGTDAFKNNQLPDNQAFIYGRDAAGNYTSTLVSYGGANRSNITIPNAVTSLTSASFGSLGLTGTLNTGNGLTSVEASKFSSNTLTNVIIGNAVTTIGTSAFSNNLLANVTVGNAVTAIGANAFLNNQILNLTIGSSVGTIGYGAFKSNKIVTLVLPDSLVTIDNAPSWPDGAFASNPVTSVTFGSGITTIGIGAFSFTDKLANVDFSRSVNLTTIADCAFIYSGLVALDLSNSTKLSSIGEHAFKYGKIADLKINGDNLNIKTWAFESNLIANLELNGKIINIGADAFKNNQLPDNQAFIYGRDASGNQTGSLVSYAGANRSNIAIPNGVTSLANASFGSLGLTGTLNTGNGLTNIESSKFSSNALTSVIIGDAVTTIGANAFLSNQITNLILGNSVATIGYGAFKGNKLATLVLPDSLKTIESPYSWPDGTFANNLLTSVTFGSGIETIGSGAFYGNSNLGTIDFNRATKLITISTCAFYNGILVHIELPESVLNVGDSAFRTSSTLSTILAKGKVNSTNFTSLGSNWYGTATVTYELNSCYTYSGNTITDYNSQCSKNIDIPTTLGGNTITTLANNSFASKGLTRAVLPSTITTVGNDVFTGNTMESISVAAKTNQSNFVSAGTNWNGSNHVVYQNDNASCFDIVSNVVSKYYDITYCSKDMIIPTGVTEIATNAFTSENLSSVTIPSTVTTIGNTPFTGNLLSSVTVNTGTNFTSLGTSWNGNVLKVNFQGTSIENNCFDVSGNSITKYKTYCPEAVVIPASVEGTNITSLAANSFLGSAVRYITIPSTIISIGANAFEGNDIVTLSLVSGLDTIGASAFKDTGLLTLTLPDTVENIGADAFKDNTSLTVINVQGKTSSADFTSLGTGWNGSCSNIVYLGN